MDYAYPNKKHHKLHQQHLGEFKQFFLRIGEMDGVTNPLSRTLFNTNMKKAYPKGK